MHGFCKLQKNQYLYQMKISIIIFLATISLTSCSLLDRNLCRTYISDETTFRAYSEAISTNAQFAEDKALLLAKKEIAEKLDEYILNKYNHKTFLEDPDFEGKITTATKTILTDISVVCSKTITRKGMYKSYTAIEIPKSEIDRIVTEKLKEEIR
jgi:hypothetical protein